jgi:protein-S-isoprenylcysteine O-methyltransferase Ste14
LDARKAGLKQAGLSTALLAVMMAVFFASAGRFDLPRAWMSFGAIFIYMILSTVALYRYSPELLAQRLKMRRKGSKTWDEVLMRACNLTSMLVVPVVAGLDIGRFGWSRLGALSAALGFIIFVFSSVLINWAMIENPYFEPTVRLQEDRGHQVVTTGPYSLVRHPGYLSGILWAFSIPLMIGSLYTFAPVILYSALMILRTYLEDRILHEELTGYAEYADGVRYRLFPGVW